MATKQKLTSDQFLLCQIRDQIATLYKQCARLEQCIAVDCKHPVVEPFRWKHDTGYGVQHDRDGRLCIFCKAKCHYPTMGNWTRNGSSHGVYQRRDIE